MATATKPTKASKVRAYQEKHPTASAVQVAKATGTDIGYIYAIRHSDKKQSEKAPKQMKWRHVTMSQGPAVEKSMAEQVYELTKGRERVRPIMVDLRQDADGKITEKVTEVPMEEPQVDRVEDHPLYAVFMDAIKQAMHGKGERHGGARTPFLDQPWAHYTKMHGRGFATGQAAKKLEEAASTRNGEAFEQEVFGAIVYAGMAILKERGQV